MANYNYDNFSSGLGSSVSYRQSDHNRRTALQFNIDLLNVKAGQIKSELETLYRRKAEDVRIGNIDPSSVPMSRLNEIYHEKIHDLTIQLDRVTRQLEELNIQMRDIELQGARSRAELQSMIDLVNKNKADKEPEVEQEPRSPGKVKILAREIASDTSKAVSYTGNVVKTGASKVKTSVLDPIWLPIKQWLHS
jgi:hypothetical protein